MFPQEFVNMMVDSLGKNRAEKVLEGLCGEPSVSVRVNPFKMSLSDLREHFGALSGDPVPWAENESFYLNGRPSFTLDPLFHTGAYYVQEASSMYVGKMIEKALEELGKDRAVRVLDLCAAPGGKTTQILSHISKTGELIANEVISSRVPVLAENVAKWGCSNVRVSCSDASAFASESFDIVLVDAPCSGEGMFRKDDTAVRNWSLNNVKLCAARQRRIVSDVWNALLPGGYMVYSTCTFNRFENEDNVKWICENMGAVTVGMRHFYPGEDRGEGFFAALLRKNGDLPASARKGGKKQPHSYRVYQSLFPEADKALSVDLDRSLYPTAELCREDALKFLAKEPLVFPDSPPGLILVTYKGLGLGFVKNLGKRSNNLHPMPRRIRSLKKS